MIGFLVALHPKRWRDEYGVEYRALLEESPMTPTVLLDVLRNAGRLHLAARRTLLRVLAALGLSSMGEVIAVHGGYADNVLWIPSSVTKAFLLAVVVLPWLPVIATVRRPRRWSEWSRGTRQPQTSRAESPTAQTVGPTAQTVGVHETTLRAAAQPLAYELPLVLRLSWPRRVRRAAGLALTALVAVYALLRAVVELFVVNMSQPQTYRHDWGGPHLSGVLLVHCGPGLVVVILAARRGARARPEW